MFSYSAPAQMKEQVKLAWQENGLSWTDFQAQPDPESPFSANTSSGISYYWSMKGTAAGKEYLYEVTSYFLPENSWVKGGRGSETLLAHEQLHFDITELHARKLRKALAEFDFDNAGNLKSDLQQIYLKAEKERALMQDKFDRETKHSMYEAAQIKWQRLVKEELKKLAAYSS